VIKFISAEAVLRRSPTAPRGYCPSLLIRDVTAVQSQVDCTLQVDTDCECVKYVSGQSVVTALVDIELTAHSGVSAVI